MSDNLQEWLDRIDMMSYLDREGIVYRRTRGSRGMQLNVKECPSCGNSKWKVYINENTGLGNCFAGSCGMKFNKWGFIKAHIGLSNGKVVEHIEQVAREMGYRPKRIVAAPTFDQTGVELPVSYPLPINGKVLTYLSNRGITPEIASYFKLRYCHEGYYRYRVPEGWQFQRYDRRVLIPVYDLEGNLRTFQGRDITGTAEKKYLFPPGLPASGAFLYNGFNVRDTRRIVVCEGAFDVIACKLALDEDEDLRDVVPIGTFGKHLSFNQFELFAKLKERGVEDVVWMWDGELEATQDAIKAGVKVKDMGMKVRIAMLPAFKDPNEVPASVVRQAYYSAIPLTANNALKILAKRMQMNRVEHQSRVSNAKL